MPSRPPADSPRSAPAGSQLVSLAAQLRALDPETRRLFWRVIGRDASQARAHDLGDVDREVAR
jgi:hypothetical protein